jgi:hypothetical protein
VIILLIGGVSTFIFSTGKEKEWQEPRKKIYKIESIEEEMPFKIITESDQY